MNIPNHCSIAAVVIGRNEGQRLVTCLESLLHQVQYIVYVDSGSSDNSVQEAKQRNVECISLDMSVPFTAARARNEGANYLIQKHPDLEVIQFIDGDCELQPTWIAVAYDYLNNNKHYAVVCGRRRERFPKESIYNQLCDMEWDTPIGDAMACGGDALVRVKSFTQVNGYRDDLIAGEEPEMCFRLREQGWKIYRIDAEMTLHDAAITRFSQWWNRAKRSGYAYANGYYLHGKAEEHFKRKELMSILLWAFVMPLLVIILLYFSWMALLGIILYPIQIIRSALIINKLKCHGFIMSLVQATSNLLSKFPQLLGITKFAFNITTGKEGRLIEYK